MQSRKQSGMVGLAADVGRGAGRDQQIERTAEALGRRVAADKRTVTGPAPAPAPTMYPGLDGTGVPVRPAGVEGRRFRERRAHPRRLTDGPHKSDAHPPPV